jgi:hypothetical protein
LVQEELRLLDRRAELEFCCQEFPEWDGTKSGLGVRKITIASMWTQMVYRAGLLNPGHAT